MKSSVALKEWGAAEGPDLNVSAMTSYKPVLRSSGTAADLWLASLRSQDVLTKLSMLFDYLSTAEKTYAEHDENFR